MSDSPTPAEVVSVLDEHERRDALVTLVHRAAFEAADRRRMTFASHSVAGSEHPPPVVLPDGFTPEDARTPFGNVVSVLERGVETPTEALLIGALLALSAREEPESEEAEQRFAAHAAWLAAHTPCDALLSIDPAAGDREGLWRAISRIALAPAEVAADFGRTEALLAAAALGSSHSAAAAGVRSRAIDRADDPAVRALLAAGGIAREPLQGELVPAPFRPLTTAILALTLFLFFIELARLIARYAFGYRRPAAFSLTERGLELTYRVELLGKTVRERTVLVPLANLSRVIREVDYARAGVYAGLGALVLGTYFGMGLFVDALRVPGGSSSLFAMAIALIVAGLALDFVLSSGLDGLRGRCKLLIEPHKGAVICLGSIDAAQADAMLTSVTAVASGAAGPSLLPPPPTTSAEPRLPLPKHPPQKPPPAATPDASHGAPPLAPAEAPPSPPAEAPPSPPAEAPPSPPAEAPPSPPAEAPPSPPAEAPPSPPIEAPPSPPVEAPPSPPAEAPPSPPAEPPANAATDAPTKATGDAPAGTAADAPTNATTE